MSGDSRWKWLICLPMAAVLLLSATPLWASGDLTVGLGYQTRAYKTDGNDSVYKLRTMDLTVGREFQAAHGWKFGLSLGFVLSKLNDLVFDDLPISLEYSSGSMSGLILGGSLAKSIWKNDSMDLEIKGDVAYSMSFRKTWDITDLAVAGTAKGTNHWFQAGLGPKLTFNTSGTVVPYIYAGWTFFRGTFKMNEDILDLEGTSDKTLKGRSSIEAAAGADFKLSGRFGLRTVVICRPYSGGTDIAAAASLLIRI